MTIADTERGSVERIIFVTKYPDNSVQAIPIRTDEVREIVFDHATIVERLQKLGVDDSKWNTGSWKTNPSVMICRTDGVVILYCQTTGHPKGNCKAAGPVVYPLDAPLYICEDVQIVQF